MGQIRTRRIERVSVLGSSAEGRPEPNVKQCWTPNLTTGRAAQAPVPMPHPLQLQYQQQCLQDPLFAHPRYRKICDLNRCASCRLPSAVGLQAGSWTTHRLFVQYAAGSCDGSALQCCDPRQLHRGVGLLWDKSASAVKLRRRDSSLHEVLSADMSHTVPSRGAHGFVQRAIDMQTGEEVACKFIERGRKWKPKHLLR